MDCLNCKFRFSCRLQADYLSRVFFAIGSGDVVACLDHERRDYHGIEGVAA